MENKVVLVTGAASGIGRAASIAFAKEGAKVVLVDIDATNSMNTLNLIKENGTEVLFIKCDVSSEIEVKNMIEQVLNKFGKLDCAFNNAGIDGIMSPLTQCTEDNWNRVININLKSVWLCMKYEIMHMQNQGFGAIVNTASIAGVLGFPGLSAYSASKHGVIGLTKAAALEYAKYNIRVNAICPSAVQTQLANKVDPQLLQQVIQATPMGRIAKPEEIAEAALWLCSEQSSFVTGSAMMVDGGWTAQ